MNLIKNNEVTMDDIDLATKCYDSDISTIKAKLREKTGSSIGSNLIDIPEELLEVQKDVTLSIDLITFNSLKFLSKIHTINFIVPHNTLNNQLLKSTKIYR